MTLADTLVVADDHPLFRQALLLTLSEALQQPQWLEAETVEQLDCILAAGHDPDLLLLDLQIPGAHGFSTLIHVRNHYPALPVVVISAHEDEANIRTAFRCGAAGFIPKSTPAAQLRQAVIEVLQGQNYWPAGVCLDESDNDSFVERLATLTPQQYRILMMFAEGLLNKQIAGDLHVSEATVKAHATAIFRKLGVRNRTQAVIALAQLEPQD